MKLLPSRPDGLSQAVSVRRLLAPLQAPVQDSTHVAFFARMATYSRSLPSDPQPTQTPPPGGSNSSTSISTNTIIAGVLGGVGVLLICVGVFIAVRVRYGKWPGLCGRFPWSTVRTRSRTASSQRTLCNSENRVAMASKTKQVGVMKGNASFISEHSQEEFKSTPSVEEDLGSIDYTHRRTHSKRRPIVEIDTCPLPGKYRKPSMGSRSGIQESKGDAFLGQQGESNPEHEMAYRNSMLSTYTLSLQLSRPPSSLSGVSVQTVSPIAFCDTPSNSHLPLALRPKDVTSSPEGGQPDSEDAKERTASSAPST